MLNDLEKTHKISKIHLIRELLEIEILHQLSLQPWSKNVVFYGGTALRLAYNSERFSEDIDLFMIVSVPYSLFEGWVQNLPYSLSMEATLEDSHLKRNTFFALLLIRHPDLKHAFPIKIELFRNKKKMNLDTEIRMLKSPLSSLSPLVSVPTLPALTQMKINALQERVKPRDLYDLWTLAQLRKLPFELPSRLPHFEKKIFKNELQMYLPKNHYPLIDQLWSMYEHAHQKDQKSS